MLKSQDIDRLAGALALFQQELKNEPFFCPRDMRAIYSKHGLSVSQAYNIDHDGNIELSTMLMHLTGQYIISAVACAEMSTTSADAANTRKACLYSILGISDAIKESLLNRVPNL